MLHNVMITKNAIPALHKIGEIMLITILFILSLILYVIAPRVFPEIDQAVTFMIVLVIIWMIISFILLLSKRP